MCANQRQESKKEADLGFQLIEKYLLVTTIKKTVFERLFTINSYYRV